MGAGKNRICPACRRLQIIAWITTAETALPASQAAAAVDAAAASPAALRSLAHALADDPGALARGAPPVVGRLVTELIARGSATLTVPACTACGRTGWPLNRTSAGAMCARCAHRALAAECARCHIVKPAAGRTDDGKPICERCRRRERDSRECGKCGKIAPIAVRARDGVPDICANCYRMPSAICSVCGRRRECNFAASDRPACLTCSPRAAVPCARCGTVRPPAVRWDEGPLCDRCYTGALRHRGRCARCGNQRRLVAPPGPGATTCADCAGLPVTHSCTDCGIEDKLYEQGRCARCSLARRTRHLLSGGTGQIPAQLNGVFEAIAAARTPRSALNWLRKGAAAGLLADIAAGRLPATHQALDAHPSQQAADYLRHILLASHVLPARDEGLARAQRWLSDLLTSIEPPEHRKLVQSYASWQVMHRLRRRAEASPRHRTGTAHARTCITAAAGFLNWLHAQGRTLAHCSQADADQWLSTAPGACYARDFLLWAAGHHHCPALQVPPPPRTAGTATDPGQRWEQLARLLHDDSLDITDRVAGSLLLLFGQQQSRITAMTTDQVVCRDDGVFVNLGKCEIPTPQPLGRLLIQLTEEGKSHVGVGSPVQTRWLFPGGLPGQPITAKHLADRLRRLGIPTQPGRRSALIDLAAQLPAAVLADLLNLHPTTAAKWIRQAGGDWCRYAAEIARARNHQPCE
jgi:hypothetical protein